MSTTRFYIWLLEKVKNNNYYLLFILLVDGEYDRIFGSVWDAFAFKRPALI